MAKCERCGFHQPPNPLTVLMAGLNWWGLVYFLSHVAPIPGLGVSEWIANWHWFMWWFAAIFGGLYIVAFVVLAGMWLRDPHGYHYAWDEQRS